MESLIRYFIENKRLNYILLIFIAYMGIMSYNNIPKELFPTTELEKISVSGYYSGTSTTNMDKMAVREIEDSLSSVNGINKIETVIRPGVFGITLTIDESENKDAVLTKVKDSLANVKQYLPSDMNEPVASTIVMKRDLLKIVLTSSTLSKAEIIEKAKEYKSKIAKFNYISEVTIRGDSDKEVKIALDSEKIKTYGLNYYEVVSYIRNLSYIYPIGTIEEKNNFVYLSTVNGKQSVEEWEETLLKIGEKYIPLKSISNVTIDYPESGTLSSFNNKNAITLDVMKGNQGNSIQLSKELNEFIKSENIKNTDLELVITKDTSKPINDRLNTVISNLMFGLILVFVSMTVLINFRIALVVVLGVPFSFLIGIIFIYYAGFTINIVSLLGALIVIGIVVDDAVVVSENVQRYIDEGMDKKEAAIKGTKEMFLPVTLATFTTFAAFLPMFMLTGEMGLFIMLIPVMAIMILLGSLIESLFFLPLHSTEILSPKSKNFVDWTGFQNLYERILKALIKYKKTFLLMFLIIVPLATFFTAKELKFQFFPKFDGNYVYVTGKLNDSSPLEETHKIALELEKTIIDSGKEISLKSSNLITGYRRSLAGESETGDNMFFLTLELMEQVDSNIIDKYINPVLNFTFNFNDPEKVRTMKTYEISPLVTKIIEPLKDKYSMVELGVTEDRPGMIRSDIRINLSGVNDTHIENSIKELSEKLSTIEGVNNYSTNVKYGKKEFKFKVNNYGERLGFTESSIAALLGNYYSERKIANTFNDSGIMEIIASDKYKDNVEHLMLINLKTDSGTYVQLKDIVEIVEKIDYEQIEKLNGNIIKSVFANVDIRKTTANEVMDQLKPVIDKINEAGDIDISFQGEKEQQNELKNDMQKAVVLALFLIIICLLFIFSKLKYVFMIISVIPLSLLGAFVGHIAMDINLTMPSIIGLLGLAGVVINDGIIMLDFLHGTHKPEEFFKRAKMRLRPILITSITTFLGMITLIFYASGQAVILQPIAISIGFGLLWGTILNLLYLPTLYAFVNKIK